jgi:hypothetical protein
MFIFEMTAAFDKRKIPYAIVGGYAVALHGAVRGTVDLDIILKFDRSDFEEAERLFQELGLTPRLPVRGTDVFDFREEYIKNRNLIAWSFYNPKRPSEVVDVIITHDLKKMKVEKIKVGKTTLKVLSIDDLIKMKKMSGRPQDLEDVKALESIRK